MYPTSVKDGKTFKFPPYVGEVTPFWWWKCRYARSSICERFQELVLQIYITNLVLVSTITESDITKHKVRRGEGSPNKEYSISNFLG